MPAGFDTDATIVTPEAALKHVEAHRVHGLMIGMTIASLIAAGIVQVMGGDPFAGRVHTYALLGSAVITGAYSVLYRDPTTYRPMIALVIILITIIVLLTGYYFWGVFSAYAAVVPLTIYVASHTTGSRNQAIVGVAICIVAQVAFGLATVAGWLQSRSLVEPVRGSEYSEYIAIGLFQVLTLIAGLGGLDVKRTTKHVLEEHNRALRDLAQREAQLAEARAEVIEARKAGGGGPGRFTDQVIDGFKLGEVLGRGSMGEVYAAVRVADETRCAVKLLATHLLRNASAYDRFQREAAILLTLQSPHVVRVLGVSTSNASLPYVAMERLDGIDLAQLLKDRRVIALDEIVTIATQVAAGLDDAHRAGVVHRDLKPLNIFGVGPENARTWKLLDFGIAKWSDSDGSLTRDSIVGTPGFMAPEQAAGAKVDARSDVYALGVLIYRMVTGTPAVWPGEVHAMLHEVVFKMPPQPSQVADVAPQVEAVLAIALAKSPSDRFAAAGELAQALAAAAAGQLPRALEQRAMRIIAKSPWGKWLRSS